VKVSGAPENLSGGHATNVRQGFTHMVFDRDL